MNRPFQFSSQSSSQFNSKFASIALAACCAVLASTTAQAQSSVTIGGYLDGSLIVESGGPNGSIKKLGSGASGPTRLVFRGTEDLGGGLTAGFHLESGVVIDTGGSLQQNFFGRQAFVHLGGGFGTLQAGLVYTPLFTTMRDVADPFRASHAGNAGNIMTAGFPGGPKSVGFPNPSAATGTVSSGGISRANTLMYSTPKFSGFGADLAYSFGEQAGNDQGLRTIGGSVGYADGPLTLRFAAQKTNNAAANDSAKNAIFGANYDFGPARVYAGFATNKGYGTARSDDALIGVSARFGLTTVLASYVRKNDKSPANVDASQVGLGLIYSLSKRTSLHTSFAKISNDVPKTSPAFYTVATPAGPGSGDRAFAVGIGHLF